MKKSIVLLILLAIILSQLIGCSPASRTPACAWCGNRRADMYTVATGKAIDTVCDTCYGRIMNLMVNHLHWSTSCYGCKEDTACYVHAHQGMYVAMCQTCEKYWKEHGEFPNDK